MVSIGMVNEFGLLKQTSAPRSSAKLCELVTPEEAEIFAEQLAIEFGVQHRETLKVASKNTVITRPQMEALNDDVIALAKRDPILGAQYAAMVKYKT